MSGNQSGMDGAGNMTKSSHDWDPMCPDVLRDQQAAYDAMRSRCPVAHSERLGWSLFRHEDITTVLADPETFSNVVSTRPSVPNGMDPPEHTVYRQALLPHLNSKQVESFEPVCRRLAADLVSGLPKGSEVDFVDSFALPFAALCQCAYLGWSDELAAPVRAWTRRNRQAVLAADRQELAAIASEFEAFVARFLEERRRVGRAEADLSSELMQTRVYGRRLTDAELTSILRNWTVGEVGSVAAALGILVSYLAGAPELGQQLREKPVGIKAAIEEILRVSGPLVSNRRRATKDVTLAGQCIRAGEIVSLMWISANRDEAAFEQAACVHIERDQQANLLWGAGIHICPGAELARLELRVALEALLAAFNSIKPGEASAEQLTYPENGWATLPLRLG